MSYPTINSCLMENPGKSVLHNVDNTYTAFETPVLQIAQSVVLSQINAKRDAVEQGTFTYLGKQIDSDPVSVQRIAVAAATAQMALAANAPYALNWSCADNSQLELDAMGVLGMMQALGSHGLATHLHARGLKTAVLAATTVEQVIAVDIETGWLSI